MATAASSQDDWRKVVGLPDDCTNPVFTKPDNMNPAERVMGAGICMNDGEAYTKRSVGFSSDWHYEPKLRLCEQEQAVISRVMGLYEREMIPEHRLPLKFNVKVYHGCGAVVIYRAFENYRYTDTRSDNLEQFIAVYDDKGILTDAMMMGYVDDLRDILLVEPHKDYQLLDNMENLELKFGETGEHFTINNYFYLSEKANGGFGKVEMKRYYSISPDGKIRLDKVTDGSEDYKDESSLKPDGFVGEVANPDAMEMMETMLTPMSDPQLLPRLDKVYAKLKDDKVVGERLMHLGMMVYNRNPKAFLRYVYKNRAKTSLVTFLNRAKAYQGPGKEYVECLDNTITKFSPSANARKWLKNKIK